MANFKEKVLFYLNESENQVRSLYGKVEDILFNFDYYPVGKMRIKAEPQYDSFSIYIRAKNSSIDDTVLVRVSDHHPSQRKELEQPDFNVMYSPDSSLLQQTLLDFEKQIKLRMKDKSK